jgi:hypothetical protein
MPSRRRDRLGRICSHLIATSGAPPAAATSPAATSSAATAGPAAAPVTLTPVQRDEFSSRGMLALPGALSAAETERYRALATALVDRASSLEATLSDNGAGYSFSLEAYEGETVPGFLHKVQGVNTCERAFNEIARHPSVLPLVAELLGSPQLDIFGTKFFPKLPATAALPTGGISVNWHQDNFAFGADVQADRAKQERIISMATYLDDSDEENGCFQVVPGSHRHGFLPPPPSAHQNSSELHPLDLPLPDGKRTLQTHAAAASCD